MIYVGEGIRWDIWPADRRCARRTLRISYAELKFAVILFIIALKVIFFAVGLLKLAFYAARIGAIIALIGKLISKK